MTLKVFVLAGFPSPLALECESDGFIAIQHCTRLFREELSNYPPSDYRHRDCLATFS